MERNVSRRVLASRHRFTLKEHPAVWFLCTVEVVPVQAWLTQKTLQWYSCTQYIANLEELLNTWTHVHPPTQTHTHTLHWKLTGDRLSQNTNHTLHDLLQMTTAVGLNASKSTNHGTVNCCWGGSGRGCWMWFTMLTCDVKTGAFPWLHVVEWTTETRVLQHILCQEVHVSLRPQNA